MPNSPGILNLMQLGEDANEFAPDGTFTEINVGAIDARRELLKRDSPVGARGRVGAYIHID